MRGHTRLLGVGIAACLLATPAARAVESGQTSYHFLNLGAGARTEALGEAGTVLAEGADALVWNPALLTGLPGVSASASWFRWLVDTQAGHVAVAAPWRRGGGALAVRSLSVEDFSNVAGEAAAGQSDLAVSAGGAYPLVERLDGGAAVRMIRSTVADEDASGWAFDAGLNYRYVEGWNGAVAVRNMGPAFGYGGGADEQLPTQAAVGVGGTVGELRLGVEGFWENGPGWKGTLGAEYRVRGRLALRAGSRLGEEADRAAEPWSVGVGLEARPGLSLDYSFRDGTFDPSHRLGVRWTLDRSQEVSDEEFVRSPREYFVSVLNEVIDQALVDFPRDGLDKIVVRPSVDHKAASVVSETLVARLSAMGLTAVSREFEPEIPANVDPDALARIEEQKIAAGLGPVVDPVLEFEVKESAYQILHQSRARWIGPRTVEREARAAIDFNLTDPDADEPRWTSQGSASEAEIASSNRIPNSSGYPRSAGTGKLADEKLHPLVEPAIVGGIVTGLAVIFFANRDVGN